MEMKACGNVVMVEKKVERVQAEERNSRHGEDGRLTAASSVVL